MTLEMWAVFAAILAARAAENWLMRRFPWALTRLAPLPLRRRKLDARWLRRHLQRPRRTEGRGQRDPAPTTFDLEQLPWPSGATGEQGNLITRSGSESAAVEIFAAGKPKGLVRLDAMERGETIELRGRAGLTLSMLAYVAAAIAIATAPDHGWPALLLGAFVLGSSLLDWWRAQRSFDWAADRIEQHLGELRVRDEGPRARIETERRTSTVQPVDPDTDAEVARGDDTGNTPVVGASQAPDEVG